MTYIPPLSPFLYWPLQPSQPPQVNVVKASTALMIWRPDQHNLVLSGIFLDTQTNMIDVQVERGLYSKENSKNNTYLVLCSQSLKYIYVIMRYVDSEYEFSSFFSGFYLFLQVEAPLHVEVVKLRHYLCTGWGKCFVFRGHCIH